MNVQKNIGVLMVGVLRKLTMYLLSVTDRLLVYTNHCVGILQTVRCMKAVGNLTEKNLQIHLI